MLNIVIGLICLMVANIILGSSISIFDENFDINIFFKGVLKVLFLSFGFILIYYAGYLNPNVIVININNIDLNLIDAIKYIFIMGIVYYGYEDLSKVIDILKIKANIKNNENIDEEGDNNEIIIPR